METDIVIKKDICHNLTERIAVKITKSKGLKRKANPTTNFLANKAKSVRRTETFLSCSNIYGTTIKNPTPAVIGMVDTLISRCRSDELAKHILNAKGSYGQTFK